VLKLRPYQDEAVAAVGQAWSGGMRAPVVVLPTGTGKTVVFSDLADRIVKAGGRPLILAHRDELIEQAVAKLRTQLRGRAEVGVVKGARREVWAPVVVASVQSLRSEERRRQLGNVTHIITDEAHHAVADSYVRVYDWWARARLVGVTATLLRGDGRALGARRGGIWDDVVYERDILWMIRRGHLVNVDARRVTVPDLDLQRVARRGGDFTDGSLGHALGDSTAPEVVAEAIRTHAADEAGIVFAPTVDTAMIFAEAIKGAGFAVEPVWGDMGAAERRATIARFHSGQTQWLTNCMVLTEGFDAPHASTVVIARPTSSAGLYVQMVGRVLRPSPGKEMAHVIDVVGAAGRLPLADLTTLTGLDVREQAIGDAEPRSLLGLVEDRAREEARAREELQITELTSEEVSLFGERHSAWLKTRGGTWFIPAGKRFVALLGDDKAGWNVAYGSTASKLDRGYVAQEMPTIEDAMAEAEVWISKAGAELYGDKARSWRKVKPSEQMAAFARRLGLPVLPGMRAGEVSDAISVKLVSARMGQR